MRLIGFSTGAVAKGDFRTALRLLRELHVPAIELSALRRAELEPLVSAFEDLDLSEFEYVSVHAPSRFDEDDEVSVVALLSTFARLNVPIVVHPDAIFNSSHWLSISDRLLIENMDGRKTTGRTARELRGIFEQLPAAGLCFDFGHASQVDPTLTEARLILHYFGARIRQVHLSEVNICSGHEPLNFQSVSGFKTLVDLIRPDAPIILEPMIGADAVRVAHEVRLVRNAIAHDYVKVHPAGEPISG